MRPLAPEFGWLLASGTWQITDFQAHFILSDLLCGIREDLRGRNTWMAPEQRTVHSQGKEFCPSRHT